MLKAMAKAPQFSELHKIEEKLLGCSTSSHPQRHRFQPPCRQGLEQIQADAK